MQESGTPLLEAYLKKNNIDSKGVKFSITDDIINVLGLTTYITHYPIITQILAKIPEGKTIFFQHSYKTIIIVLRLLILIDAIPIFEKDRINYFSQLIDKYTSLTLLPTINTKHMSKFLQKITNDSTEMAILQNLIDLSHEQREQLLTQISPNEVIQIESHLSFLKDLRKCITLYNINYVCSYKRFTESLDIIYGILEIRYKFFLEANE